MPMISQTCREPRETRPRCHAPRATLPHPTSRACSRGRHQIPLRHALLPRSKSRGRQQREEQDRGSNYPRAGQHTPSHVKLRPISVYTPDPECTRLNSSAPRNLLLNGLLLLLVTHSPSTNIDSRESPETFPHPQACARLFPASAIIPLAWVLPGVLQKPQVSSSTIPLPVLPLQSLFPPSSPG